MEEVAIEESRSDMRNGATWIRDCLLQRREIERAADRLQVHCAAGIRHFSAIRRAVPLDQAKSVEVELSRLEEEEGKPPVPDSQDSCDRPRVSEYPNERTRVAMKSKGVGA